MPQFINELDFKDWIPTAYAFHEAPLELLGPSPVLACLLLLCPLGFSLSSLALHLFLDSFVKSSPYAFSLIS